MNAAQSKRLSLVFDMGKIFATEAARRAIADSGTDLETVLERHGAGNWGEVDVETYKANFVAQHMGGELFSAQRLKDGNKVWIVTDWSRTSTAVMLPKEFDRSDLFTLFAK